MISASVDVSSRRFRPGTSFKDYKRLLPLR